MKAWSLPKKREGGDDYFLSAHRVYYLNGMDQQTWLLSRGLASYGSSTQKLTQIIIFNYAESSTNSC